MADDDDYFLMETSNLFVTKLEYLISHASSHEEFISLVSKLQNKSPALNLVIMSNLTSLQKMERILYLLDHGADINYSNPFTYSLSPLAMAIESEDEILINFLITKGADVNLLSEDSSYPLQTAIAFPYLVRLLLSKGADPDLSYALYSAIDIASYDEYGPSMGLESFYILLEAGANPDFPNKDGATALMEACKHRLYELLPILIEHCDIDLQNTYTGETALHIAIDQKINKETIVRLLEKNPNLEIEDNKNQTALLKAILSEYIPVIELLLRAGADPWCIDGDDHSYLHYAIESRSPPIIEAILIRRQLDIEEGKVSADQEIVSEEDLEFASSIFKSIVPLLLRYR